MADRMPDEGRVTVSLRKSTKSGGLMLTRVFPMAAEGFKCSGTPPRTREKCSFEAKFQRRPGSNGAPGSALRRSYPSLAASEFSSAVGSAIGVREASAALGHPQIDIRVGHFIVLGAARPDLQVERVLAAAILQLVAIRGSPLKAGAVAGAKNFFAVVGDQHEFTLQHIDEFIFDAVP